MRVLSGLVLAAVALIARANAQASTQLPQAPAPQPDAQTAVQFAAAPAAAKLMTVDVAVQDRSGHAVRGFTSRDFRLTEDGAQQTLLSVEEHSALPLAQQFPALPTLPPGTFANYTPVAPGGTLNILLIDALNTPTEDQAFLRNQLQQYAEAANSGTRIAIFGLADSLVLLQGFTSDPSTLKGVMEHKLIPRVPLSNGRSGDFTGQPKDRSAVLSATYLAANLQEFRAETHAMETQLRAQYTLDAFNTLGHYLEAFPGRKNLIWFSGSFPASILPDPSVQHAADVTQVDAEEFGETADLLAQAQVAVYPADAHGMMIRAKFDASAAEDSNTAAARQDSAEFRRKTKAQPTEQEREDRLASDSGGEVIDDAKDLAGAVAEVVAAGADYYSLGYRPADAEEVGEYRTLRLTIAGTEAGRGLKLSYRRGYYAGDAAPLGRKDEAAAAYAQAAMSRGAPMPENLLMKVRVLPASSSTESSPAPGNTLDASVSPKGPFRRYDLDYAALANELTLKLQPDGRRTGQMEFLAYVFDTYGRLLNATGKIVEFDLDPATYNRLMQSSIGCHLEVSVPADVATFIRAGVRDTIANNFGVVEIPTSVVSQLAPAVYKEPATP